MSSTEEAVICNWWVQRRSEKVHGKTQGKKQTAATVTEHTNKIERNGNGRTQTHNTITHIGNGGRKSPVLSNPVITVLLIPTPPPLGA